MSHRPFVDFVPACLVQKFELGRRISLVYTPCNTEDSDKSFRLVGPQRQLLFEQA